MYVTGDINGDSLIDIVGGAWHNDTIFWWENTGNLNFTEHYVKDFGPTRVVDIYDINSDGYPDIVAVGWQIGKVILWLNDGINQTNWTKVVVDPAFSGGMGVGLAYLDSDSFIDIYATSLAGPGYLVWYKNDGLNPPVWTKQIIDQNLSGAWPLTSGDIDKDGKIDIVSGANYSDYVNWYKNEIVTAVNEFPMNNSTNNNFQIYNFPNPFSEHTTICFSLEQTTSVEVSIFDITGNKIVVLLNRNFDSGLHSVNWDGTDMNSKRINSGIYFYQIRFDDLIYKTQDMIFIR